MGVVDPSGPPPRRINIYAGAALLGVILMVTGIVGGVILKDLPLLAVVATTIPGIALLLIGIRGDGSDQAPDDAAKP
jgi:hypothetical protein